MGSLPNTTLLPGGYLRKYGDRIKFKRGENPIEYIMGIIGDSYPSFPDVWTDKSSDEALTRMCLNGLGPHRLERCEGGYVVRTNALASFDVAEGYERYGGDACADALRRLILSAARTSDSLWLRVGTSTRTFAQSASCGWSRARRGSLNTRAAPGTRIGSTQSSVSARPSLPWRRAARLRARVRVGIPLLFAA